MKPIGTLTALFPGPSCFGADNWMNATETKSKLCEMIWVEPALFHSTNLPLTILTEGFYGHLASNGHDALKPGSLGEQFVFQSPALDNRAIDLQSGDLLQLGDAKLIVVQMSQNSSFDAFSPAIEEALISFPVLQVAISEEGLVEPGAPVYLL